jgi:hypothetical protein
MVIERPLIEKRDLINVLDPIHGHGEAEYRRLRQAHVLSPGLVVHPRDGSRLQGTVTFYCSLNRDLISAFRDGRMEAAGRIRGHAERIERDSLRPWLDEVLKSDAWIDDDRQDETPLDTLGEGRPFEWISRALYSDDLMGREELSRYIWEAACKVSEVRARLSPDDLKTHVTLGRVWKIDDRFAQVRTGESDVSESFVFFAEEVFAAGLRLGDPVAIRHEELRAGVLLTSLERGLEAQVCPPRLSNTPLPAHLDQLLDEESLGKRIRPVQPLRRVA